MSVPPPIARRRATVDDLALVPEKAELIGGEIVRMSPTGYRPSELAAEIFVALRAFVKANGVGIAFTDNIGFTVPELSSGRESFSPDASFYNGPMPENVMDFVLGAPTFAVEVRSKEDYWPSSEPKLAAKRADYFEAGTLVVWDVDTKAELVRIFRREAPDRPEVRGMGDQADAEPALPDWRITVAEIFGR